MYDSAKSIFGATSTQKTLGLSVDDITVDYENLFPVEFDYK